MCSLKISQIGRAAQRGQFSETDYRVSLGTLLYLNILVDGLPHTCANHVHVNVYQTTMQVLVGFNGGGVITIFPECALPAFALVVFLRSATRDELHASGSTPSATH